MPTFQLCLLGPFQCTGPDGTDIKLRSDKVRALLSYLVLEAPGKPVRRSYLTGLFWPDYLPKSAGQNFRNTLSDLRKALAPLDILRADSKTVTFTADHPDFWCDALETARLSDRRSGEAHDPPLLQGFHLDDCPRFMAWLEDRRAALQARPARARPNTFPQDPIDLPSSAVDWGDMPARVELVGREAELAQLEEWRAQGAKVIGIFGIGGQGKSALAAEFMRSLQTSPNKRDSFGRTIWRSLINAPPWKHILRDWVDFLSGYTVVDLPDHLDRQLNLLVDLLYSRPAVLVLDNLETILQSSNDNGRFHPGYEAYGEVIRRLAHSQHAGCLILTGRERPQGFQRLVQTVRGVHALGLTGLSTAAGAVMLQQQAIHSDETTLAQLAKRYDGNPLALLLAAQTVHELFTGDVGAFLSIQQPHIFGDIQDVLAEQFARLSPREEQILFRLAIAREPVALERLMENYPVVHAPAELLDAIRSLQRRNLLLVQETTGETHDPFAAAKSRFSLQNVVMEYVTEQLISHLAREISDGDLSLLCSLPLTQADSSTHIRDIQSRLLLQPLAQRLVLAWGQSETSLCLRRLLDSLRLLPKQHTGYAASNILHLLLRLDQAINGADFSHLSVRQAYLRGVHLTDVNFLGSDLTGSVFTDLIGTVRCVAVQPGGRKIVAGVEDGHIWVWQMPDQSVYPIPHAHPNGLKVLTFSPDGALLASCGLDESVRLWDMQSDQMRCEITKSGGRTLSFSPDGRILAGGENRNVWLWDVENGCFLSPLLGHNASIVSVAFAPNGALLACSDTDGRITIWEWPSARLLTEWQGASVSVEEISFHPDSTRLVGAIRDDCLQVWDVQGKPLTPRLQGQSHFRHVAFSPNGDLLAGACHDGDIYIWQTETGRRVHLLRGHQLAALGVAFYPDGGWLVSGSADQTVRIWDTTTGRLLHELPGHRRSIAALAISPDGALLACAGNGMGIHLWRDRPLQEVRQWPTHQHLITSLAFSPDGSLLASASGDLTISIWESANGRQSRVLLGHAKSVERVAFHPRLPWLVSGGLDGTVRVWDVASGSQLYRLDAHTLWVSDLAFSPDGEVLASCGGDRRICLWRIEPGVAPVQIDEIPVPDVQAGYGPLASFHPTASQLTFSTDRRIFRYYLLERRLTDTLSGHRGWTTGLAYSPDGAALVSVGIENSLSLWDEKSGAVRWRREVDSQVNAVVFHPDSATLYTGSIAGDVSMWDAQSGALLQTTRIPGPYAGMNIRGVTGISRAQRAALLALGAVEG